VATDPTRHPIDEEIERIFEANPGLREELDEAEREIESGDADLVDHEEALRIIGRSGNASR
jgi:hypothetical protein